MKERIKGIVKRNTYLAAVLYTIHNLKLRLQYAINIRTNSGATHSTLTINDSINYIEDVFSDYQKVSGRLNFPGKIAEIGPGDSSGVAMMFLAHGADHVDLADRFYSIRSDDHHAKVYAALAKKYPKLSKILKDVDLKTLSGLSQLVRYYGDQSSGEIFFETHKDYDVVISRSVLEHVDDPELVLRRMYDALKPGGVLIHKVDLRDHGMFTPYAESTKFLEIPSCLYRAMTYRSGYPNRFLFHDYKRVLAEICPNHTKFFIAAVHGMTDSLTRPVPVEDIPDNVIAIGTQAIQSVRYRLAKKFRGVPTQDLMINSFFFVCEKPVV